MQTTIVKILEKTLKIKVQKRSDGSSDQRLYRGLLVEKTLLSRVLLTFSDMTCSLASVWMASKTSDPPYCVWLYECRLRAWMDWTALNIWQLMMVNLETELYIVLFLIVDSVNAAWIEGQREALRNQELLPTLAVMDNTYS